MWDLASLKKECWYLRVYADDYPFHPWYRRHRVEAYGQSQTGLGNPLVVRAMFRFSLEVEPSLLFQTRADIRNPQGLPGQLCICGMRKEASASFRGVAILTDLCWSSS